MYEVTSPFANSDGCNDRLYKSRSELFAPRHRHSFFDRDQCCTAYFLSISFVMLIIIRIYTYVYLKKMIREREREEETELKTVKKKNKLIRPTSIIKNLVCGLFLINK